MPAIARTASVRASAVKLQPVKASTKLAAKTDAQDPAAAKAAEAAKTEAAAKAAAATLGKEAVALAAKSKVKAKPVSKKELAAQAAAVASAAKAKVQSAKAQTQAVPARSDVIVDIKASDSGYENQIYWSSDNFVTRHYLGVDNHTASVNLGSFAAGTQIDFGIVNGNGQFFRTGGAGANADGLAHTRQTAVDGGLQIGFEDLYGGGDNDFNDAILQVRRVAAAASPATAGTGNQDNRSGLGDGTNPGQGAGRDNSPNMGTLNPSNATAAGLYAAVGAMA